VVAVGASPVAKVVPLDRTDILGSLRDGWVGDHRLHLYGP
jgi:hypothetical protein